MTNSTTNQNGSAQNERAKVTGDTKMLPWWSKCEPSSSMRKNAKEHIGLPLRAERDVQFRLKLCPHNDEANEILRGFFHLINYGSIKSPSSAKSQCAGYICYSEEGKVHPKFGCFQIPNDLWVYDEEGYWLNPLTPCQICLNDTGAHQLFGLEDINYDIWAIPLYEERTCGGGDAWYKSSFVATLLADGIANALFCMARVPFREEADIAATLKKHDSIRGQFGYRDEEYVIVTWLLEWPIPSNYDSREHVAQSEEQRTACEKRKEQEKYLYPTSYDAKFFATVARWREQVASHEAYRRRTGYSTQLEEVRNLFNSSNIRERAKQSDYLIDLSGKVAVLYREKTELVPGKKPKRKRTFSREFELSSSGLEMMRNFLTLQEAVDKIPSEQLLHLPKGNFSINL